MLYSTIITSEKIKSDFILQGEAQYIERMRPFMKFEFLTCGSNSSTGQSALYAKKIPEGAFVFILDERGKSLDSLRFSNLIRDKADSGRSRFAFLIGPAEGFDEETKSLADMSWSLSPLTFPHQLCRLLVVEQLYRALTIISGHPYHKT